MDKKIVVATHNPNKVREFKEVLEPLGYQVYSDKDFNVHNEPNEDGKNYQENAYIKAHALCSLLNIPVISDDSGIEIDGLGEGFPHGLKTPEPDNYEKMLEIAREFSRGTRFSRIDMYNIGGRIYFGEFTLYPKSGLGYFLPEEWNIKIGDMLEL